MSTGREKSSPFPHSSSPIFSQIEHQNTSPSEKDGICILSSRDILRLIQSMNFLYICIEIDSIVFSCFARCLRLWEALAPLTTMKYRTISEYLLYLIECIEWRIREVIYCHSLISCLLECDYCMWSDISCTTRDGYYFFVIVNFFLGFLFIRLSYLDKAFLP